MHKAIVINGSPRTEKGNTARLLAPFVRGMEDAGAEVALFYASRLDIKPCACGEMACWYRTPGKCVYKDDMQPLLAKAREADTLILATPVYVPLPGAMQNVVNRLCPLVTPHLETRDGRTRTRFADGVRIRRMALVSTSGWWELGNFGTVVRIAQELAENTGVPFAGAVLRPHASLMRQDGKLTEQGQAVLDAAHKAGRELVQEGTISQEILDAVSRPLIPQETLRRMLNRGL
jgi:multimeric flavodoxin WrbA